MSFMSAPESTRTGIPRAPIGPAQRAMLMRRLANLDAIARRRGTTLDAWDRANEERAGQIYFEVGAWGWWSQQRRDSLSLNDRANVVFAVLASGLTSVGYEFFTAFEFSERDWDSFFEMHDGSELVQAVSDIVHRSGHATALVGLQANGWVRPVRQSDLFAAGFVE